MLPIFNSLKISKITMKICELPDPFTLFFKFEIYFIYFRTYKYKYSIIYDSILFIIAIS